MGETGMMRPLTGWQRANVLTAAHYVREVLVKTPDDKKARAVYDGLLEVLEPARRVARQQREMAQAAKAAAVRVREQRSGRERRVGERRRVNLGPPGGVERRKVERRTGRDRRKS